MALRGAYDARIDDRNRLKVPAEFRRLIEARWGQEVFVTTLKGQEARIFPIPVWERFEEQLQSSMSFLNPIRERIQTVLNWYGQTQRMDGQGRVLLHSKLKDHVQLDAEVTVLGQGDHLSVRTKAQVAESAQPLSAEELETFEKLLWRNG